MWMKTARSQMNTIWNTWWHLALLDAPHFFRPLPRESSEHAVPGVVCVFVLAGRTMILSYTNWYIHSLMDIPWNMSKIFLNDTLHGIFAFTIVIHIHLHEIWRNYSNMSCCPSSCTPRTSFHSRASWSHPFHRPDRGLQEGICIIWRGKQTHACLCIAQMKSQVRHGFTSDRSGWNYR